MSQGEHGADGVHIMSPKALLGVWGALIALTILTVALKGVDLGRADLVVALGIATVKGLLVALFFMHLLYDRGFHGLVVLGALLFVMLFVSLTLLDRNEYQPDIDARTVDLRTR